MMKSGIQYLLLIFVFAISGCTTQHENDATPGADAMTDSAPTSEPATQPRELNMETAAQQANDFAANFYGEVAKEEAGNLFFSPLSIHSALSMTFAGSAGETAKQMGSVLSFDYSPTEGIEHHAYSLMLQAINTVPVVRFESFESEKRRTVERPAFDLVLANRLWGQEGFPWNPGYLQTAKRQYMAGLEEVGFRSDPDSARKIINAWVEETTRDRIKDLIPSGALNELTRLVLTNAIYFKANWNESFAENDTTNQPFFLSDGGQVDVPLMTQTDHLNYHESDDWQMVELPYELKALSMLLVLPEDNEGSMARVEAQLASGQLLEELKALERTRVELWMPKFSQTQELDLNSTLSAMGMPVAFTDRADFSGMSPDSNLYLSKALHKAFIEVDEKGTEAAAATAAIVSFTSAPPPETPKVFRADRPFLYIIHHNATGAILFIGRVTVPR